MKPVTLKNKLMLKTPEKLNALSIPEVPTLNLFEQDDIVAELLENQLRRRAQTRFGTLPQWSYW
jgi:hypothetical protein